jgi:hypothetical protein
LWGDDTASGTSASLTRTAFAQTTPKAMNIVLLHGVFAGGSSWSEVIPRLQAVGLNVTSVQNPLTTLPKQSMQRCAFSDDRMDRRFWRDTHFQE